MKPLQMRNRSQCARTWCLQSLRGSDATDVVGCRDKNTNTFGVFWDYAGIKAHARTEDYCTDARDVIELRNSTKSSELERKPFHW